jgi:hypothetical protein
MSGRSEGDDGLRVCEQRFATCGGERGALGGDRDRWRLTLPQQRR